jgi:integrase
MPMKPNNRPQRGDVIKVQAIRTEKDVRLIKRLLNERPRDYCLFVLGINTNLRAGDISRITVGQVRHLQPGEHFVIREQKTGKLKQVTVNRGVCDAVSKLVSAMSEVDDGDFLFQSQKGNNQALEVSSIHRLVKSWCREINLKGNYGSHTLRKTFGYIHRTVHGTDIPTLMEMFNHASQKQTLAYLGIQAADVQNAYLKEI